MLQSIRDRTQGWIAGVIVSLLILSFALWGIHSYFVGGSVNSAVAEVNGIEITQGQLSVAYERLRRQMQNSQYDMLGTADAGLKTRALQGLIDLQVLKQASLKQDYRVSANQVNSFLESMPEFQVDGQFSVTRFQQLLSMSLYSASDFLDLIKTSLLIDQPRLGMIFTSFALPYEIDQSIALVNQERKIRYFILPYATVSNQSIQIPEEKIQAYYDSHQDEFKTPEQVSIEYIEFSMKDVINNIQPSEQELQDFYSDNQSLFVEPARWKLDSIVIPAPASFTPEELAAVKSKVNEIYEKAKTGESFAKLETEYLFQHAPNIDAKNWVTQNQIPAELQKVLATLKARDQVTEPMQTSQGFVILKAVDFINVSNQSFEQVKPKVIEKLKQQKAEEKFTDIREKLASSSYEHPESLQATSQLLNLPIKTTELFSQDKPGKDISANSKIREAAFSQDVLNLQNNSDVIQLTADSVAVIRVKSHELSALLPLKTVRAQIENQLTKSEVEEKTLQVAQDIIAKLKNNDSASQVLQEYKVKWNNVGWIARHATNVNPAILETAFNMQKTDQNNSVTYETTKLSEGYGIIALDEVKDGQLIDKDEYKVFAEQIQNTQGLLEYELYKQSVVDQAKIVAK